MTATGAICRARLRPERRAAGQYRRAALKSSYQNGRRVLTAVQSVRTNDRGEYRLFWLAPGRYIVRATHPQAETGLMAMLGRQGGGGFQTSMGWEASDRAGSLRNPKHRRSGAVRRIRPGRRRAEPIDTCRSISRGRTTIRRRLRIDLRAGADVGAIDVPVIPVRERHVRGVVINGATGQVAQYAGLSEIRAGSLPGDCHGRACGRTFQRRPRPIDPDGSFDVTLLPGRHTLMGTAGTGVGFVSLEVRDADLDGVRIVAMPEFNVTGRIVTDAPVENARPDERPHQPVARTSRAARRRPPTVCLAPTAHSSSRPRQETIA